MIYTFGFDTGQNGNELFDNAHPDFRGEVGQRHTVIAIYNPESDDLKLARKLADEIINVSGAEVKVYVRTDNADYDSVWDADADPTYWNCKWMKAYFKPGPLEMELDRWGAEAKNKTEIVFSHRQIFQLFETRMLRIGDVIQIPYNAAMVGLNPKNYRITNATPSGNFRYNWLYLTCQVEVLTADLTVRPDGAAPMPVELDQAPEVYRESF